jgi:hypothetical protein
MEEAVMRNFPLVARAAFAEFTENCQNGEEISESFWPAARNVTPHRIFWVAQAIVPFFHHDVQNDYRAKQNACTDVSEPVSVVSCQGS